MKLIISKEKSSFSPFAAIPDQIKHMIHGELPFFWILIFLLLFALLSFAGLRYMLSNQSSHALAPYQNVISAPARSSHYYLFALVNAYGSR
jgi:type VI secretion system protein ImpK